MAEPADCALSFRFHQGVAIGAPESLLPLIVDLGAAPGLMAAAWVIFTHCHIQVV